MKIRINNRVVDMPLRCFEFSPIAKENTKYISQIEITHQGKQYKVEETYPPFPLTLKTLSYIDDELRNFLDRLYNDEDKN